MPRRLGWVGRPGVGRRGVLEAMDGRRGLLPTAAIATAGAAKDRAEFSSGMDSGEERTPSFKPWGQCVLY